MISPKTIELYAYRGTSASKHILFKGGPVKFIANLDASIDLTGCSSLRLDIRESATDTDNPLATEEITSFEGNRYEFEFSTAQTNQSVTSAWLVLSALYLEGSGGTDDNLDPLYIAEITFIPHNASILAPNPPDASVALTKTQADERYVINDTTTSSLLGRYSSGSGDFEVISIGSNLSLSGSGVLSAEAGLDSSEGGNGSSDFGKAALFDADGALTSSDFIYLYAGDGSGHVALSLAPFTGPKNITIIGEDGTLATREWVNTSYTGSSAITTVGTITSGSWNGTVGAITPNTGAFTTGSFSGALTLGTSGILVGGTNTIEQRNSTNEQKFNIYNTYTDASNYERASLLFVSNTLVLRTEALGTGTARSVIIQAGTGGTLSFRTNGTTNKWQIDTTGNFLAAADNTYDIGASGATRPRNLYIAGNGTFGGDISATSGALTLGPTQKLLFSGNGGLFCASDGVFNFRDVAQTSFGRLQFGGTTSSFPAIKRSSATLAFRLADDSADCAITAGAITASGAVTASANGADSAPAVNITGAPFAGTGITSFPLVYVNETGATASTTLNTAGTLFGVNGNGTADLMNLLKDGVSQCKVTSGGVLTATGGLTIPVGSVAGNAATNSGLYNLDDYVFAIKYAGSYFMGFFYEAFRLSNNSQIAWSSTASINATMDTYIGRKSAANLRQGAADAAAPVAQTFSVQNVSTGTSNTAGVPRYFDGCQGTGTGAGGDIIFRTAPAGSAGSSQNALAAALTISASGSATFSASLTIGASGNFSFSGRTVISSASNGVLTIWNNAGTDFSRLQLGGATSSFPAIKRNGAAINFRLADDSADCDITAAAITASGPLITTPQALSGAGAINLTTGTTAFTSTGAAQALTLADGTNGQIKTIVHVADGGSGVLTPTTASGYTTITFTNIGDSVTLQFFTGAGWCIVGIFGAVAA